MRVCAVLLLSGRALDPGRHLPDAVDQLLVGVPGRARPHHDRAIAVGAVHRRQNAVDRTLHPRRGKAEPFGDDRDRQTGTPPLADVLRALLHDLGLASATRSDHVGQLGAAAVSHDLVDALARDPVALADLAKRPARRSELEHLPVAVREGTVGAVAASVAVQVCAMSVSARSRAG